MKRIIISANVLFTIANFRKELIKSLISNDYEVICVSDDDELSGNSKSILNSLGVIFERVKVSRKGLNPIEDIKYFLSLVKIYKKYKPEMVMHFTIKPNIYGTLAAKIGGIKSINTINGLGSAIIADNFLSKILKLMYRVSLNYSTVVFFQNTQDKIFFEDNNIINKDVAKIVPGSGVDCSYFVSSEKRHVENKTFLLIARLLKDKGIYEYIEAVKIIKNRYKDVNFLLAGPYDDGNPTAIKENEVQKWQEEGIIKYIGQTNDIREFFDLSDVIVLPSYREGLSRVLIEASSASKPIITTDVPGCKDIVIDSHNGYLCKAKDENSLAKSIEKMILLSDKEFQKFSINSSKIAENKFDKSIVNKIYLDAIQREI